MFTTTKLRRGMILTRIRGGCQTLNQWGKIRVSPPCLIFPSFLVLSNYHFNALQSSWGSYGWGVECGKVVSPCPHAHSTNRLTLTLARKTTTTITPCELFILTTMPFSPFSVHPHAGTIVLFILTHKILSCFGLMKPGEGAVFHCHSHFPRRGIWCVSIHIWDLV